MSEIGHFPRMGKLSTGVCKSWRIIISESRHLFHPTLEPSQSSVYIISRSQNFNLEPTPSLGDSQCLFWCGHPQPSLLLCYSWGMFPPIRIRKTPPLWQPGFNQSFAALALGYLVQNPPRVLPDSFCMCWITYSSLFTHTSSFSCVGSFSHTLFEVSLEQYLAQTPLSNLSFSSNAGVLYGLGLALSLQYRREYTAACSNTKVRFYTCCVSALAYTLWQSAWSLLDHKPLPVPCER